MARFAGLDVSDRTTHVCVVDETDGVVWPGVVAIDPEALARGRPHKLRYGQSFHFPFVRRVTTQSKWRSHLELGQPKLLRHCRNLAAGRAEHHRSISGRARRTDVSAG